MSEQLETAARRLADMFASDADMFAETMQSLSCIEAEALADVVRLAGYPSEAALLIEEHAETDEPGELHHGYGAQEWL